MTQEPEAMAQLHRMMEAIVRGDRGISSTGRASPEASGAAHHDSGPLIGRTVAPANFLDFGTPRTVE